jgi:PRTRC genetic system ParB family protein
MFEPTNVATAETITQDVPDTDADNAPIGELRFIATDSIDASLFENARRKRNAKFDALKQNIRLNGINQSLGINLLEDGSLMLISGFTRFTIAKELNLSSVPCMVKRLSSKDALDAHIVENVLRADLSLVEQARVAQRFLTECEGDHDEATKRLGWESKKLKDRLQLCRCTNEVLDALDDEKIKLGHAIRLSSFNDKIQNGTLAKIIAENWSVTMLDERAKNAKKPLKNAPFDTTECEQCPNNTIHQRDMFSSGVNEQAMCAKLTCYKAKKDAWLVTKKVALEEQYGTVLLLAESNTEDRNTISEDAVGKPQLVNCQSCESNVVLMDDRDSKEGQVIPNQCVNKTCFSQCQTAHKKATSTPKTSVKTVTPNGKETATKTEDASISEKPKQEAVNLAKPIRGVDEHEQRQLAQATYVTIKDRDNLALAMSLTTFLSTKVLDVAEWQIRSSMQDHEVFAICMSQSKADLDAMLHTKVNEFLATNKGLVGESRTPVSYMLGLVKKLDNQVEIASSAFKADTETFDKHRKNGIQAICADAGFVKAFDDDPDNKANKRVFSQLFNLSKGDFIKEILLFEFDWSAYTTPSIKARLR